MTAHLLTGVAAIALAVTALAAERTSPTEEYAVRGALIFNFMRFVDWPQTAWPPNDAPLIVGVLARTSVEGFESAVHDRMVHGRRIAVRTYRTLQDVEDCHVLFVTADLQGQLAAVLRASSGKPVLTISETLTAERAEAVINLVALDTRLGFQVNLDAAETAGLRLSSRLLTLATVVSGSSRKGGRP